MTLSQTNIRRARAQLERVFAQGLIEKAFPAGGPESACTARIAFDQEHGWQGPDDGGFAMRRGLFAGSLAEHELQSYATDKGFSVALGNVVDSLMKAMSFGQLGVDRQHELRKAQLTGCAAGRSSSLKTTMAIWISASE